MADKQIVSYEASDGSQVKLSPEIVARYIVTGGQQVDDREVMSFMAKCQARHLNPLAGDAYMTAYRNKRTGKVETSVIVSKDYFVRTATQQPGYDGMQAGVVVANRRTGELTYRVGSIVGGSSEDLVGGWAEVYDKTRSHPSRAEVSLAEYNTGRSLWNSKPATMIRKVALVQALREAYPGAFGGVYDSSEMLDRQQPQQVEAKAEAVPEPAAEQPKPKPKRNDAEYMQPVRQLYKSWKAARGFDNDQAIAELQRLTGATSMASMNAGQATKAADIMRTQIAEAQQEAEPEEPEEADGEQPSAEETREAEEADLYETDVEW